MQKNIDLVKKWLADPESVSYEDRLVNMNEAKSAFISESNWSCSCSCEERTLLEVVSEASKAAVYFSAVPIKASKLVEEYEAKAKVEAENKAISDRVVSRAAKIKGTHHHSFRHGEWAHIIGVKICKIEGLEPRPCYQCLYDDGLVDYIAISDSPNYEIGG